MSKEYRTAQALVMARVMKRLAGKYGDLDLARRAKELDKEARSALTKRQSALRGIGETVSDGDLSDRMPRYKVIVDDNFHYQKGDRWEQGVYNTLQEAVVACRGIVDKSLEDGYRPGISAKELYDHYVNFGDDPFIIALNCAEERAEFSAWSYAKERCRVICEERSQMTQAAANVPASQSRKILGLPQDGQALPATRTAPSSVLPVLTLDQETSTRNQISESGEFPIVKSTITAFVAKLKRSLGRVGDVIRWVVIAWVGIALIVQTIRLLTGTADWEPRAGDSCGPGHRYVWIGVGPNSDLSCEPE